MSDIRSGWNPLLEFISRLPLDSLMRTHFICVEPGCEVVFGLLRKAWRGMLVMFVLV